MNVFLSRARARGLLCLFCGASWPGSLSPSNLDLFDGGNDLGGEEIEGLQVGHIGQTDNRLVNAHRRQFAEISDGGSRGPALLPAIPGEMNLLNDGFLDVRIRAAYALAVLARIRTSRKPSLRRFISPGMAGRRA